jgi:AcrR family transcriptional regulator
MNNSFNISQMPRTEEALQQIREGRREKILNAAKTVFARKGSAATIADIASEAGISQGLAYSYFTSKEEIFTTLVKQSIQSAGEYDKVIRRLPGSPAERLSAIITRLVGLRREQPGYYQFLYQILSDDSMPNVLREMMSRQGRILQKEMRQLIVEGQASGEIAKDNPDKLLEAIMACVEGLWRRMTYSDPKKTSESFPDAKIMLRMLEPHQEKEPRK